MLEKLVALLHKFPAESARLDWLGGALVLAYVAAYFLGVPPEQLPDLVDAALGALALIGLRGASLTAKRKAALDSGLALAKALADVKAGKPLPEGVADQAIELVNALADADTAPIDVEVPHA